MKKTTEDLQNIMKTKKSYAEFFEEEIDELEFQSLAEYLNMLVKQKNLHKNDVIARSNLDRSYGYQIFNGTKTKPARDKVLMLAIGMGLTPAETNKLLKICQYPELYVRLPRDAAIYFSIDNGNDIMETNATLEENGMDILE
ncbi:MAG: helix-turn-helix domain-containing protein [Clostridia bacterium]|jgi:hypothetical protein|nr:helix-turn-helix domain-containing protein [Clostridia bacterium]